MLWSRNVRVFVLLLVLALAAGVLYAARALIGPLLIAALLAYILNPLVTSINRRSRLPRSAVILLFYLLMMAAIIVLAVTLTPLLANQARVLSRELQQGILEMETILSERIVVLGFEVAPDEILGESNLVADTLIRSDRIVSLLEAATTNLVWILVILVTTYYLLQDWERLREWLLDLAPPGVEADLRQLYERIRHVWQGYLRGQLLLMLFTGFLTGIVLAAVGLPGAVIIGLLTALLDVIPTLGPALALIVAALIAWLNGSTYLPLSPGWFLLLVLGLHGAVQAIENAWLRPHIMGHRLQLHPAVVFVGIVGALYLVGALGALVVVPVLGTTAIIGSYIHHRILGLDPWAENEKEQLEAGDP